MNELNETVSRQFFALLRLAVTGKKEDSLLGGDVEWESLFRLAQSHALTGVCFAGIERLPGGQVPPRELLLRWYALAERIKRQNLLVQRRIVELVRRFDSKGFESVILKGCGVARLYDGPLRPGLRSDDFCAKSRLELLRMSGDIDVWVPYQNRKRILEYLRATSTSCYMVYHNAEYPVFEDVPVEVHFTPSWFWNPWRNYRFQRFCRMSAAACVGHRVKMGDAGMASVPIGGFNKVYILQHIYRHVFGEGIGLRQLMDYYFVLAAQPDEGEPESGEKEYRIIRQLGMERFCAAVMWILQYVFALSDECLLCPPDEHEGRLLLHEIMTAGNFGQSDERNRHAAHETAFARLYRNTRRNLRFLKSYWGEVLCIPFWKMWHFLWRRQFR